MGARGLSTSRSGCWCKDPINSSDVLGNLHGSADQELQQLDNINSLKPWRAYQARDL